MKETACQRELALMLDKRRLGYSLMDVCLSCAYRQEDRPSLCRKAQCHIGLALEKAGYAIPLRSEWE